MQNTEFPKTFGHQLTPATWVTMLRIILIPVMVVLYYLPFQYSYIGSALVFVVASLSDWFDGYLARKYDQHTPIGAFLDPVADKLIVAAALVMLSGANHLHYVTVPAMVIIGREISISALREWMAEMGQRAKVSVNMIGKTKTTFQMFAISFLLGYGPSSHVWMLYLGMIFLYSSAVLTIWSMFIYLKIAWNTSPS